MRPPMLAGPIERQRNDFRTESSDWLIAAAGGAGACGGWARPTLIDKAASPTASPNRTRVRNALVICSAFR